MRLVLLLLAIAGAKSTGKETRPQIYSLHVQSDIHYRYAHTLVTSKIANPSNFSQEVTFTVVLPDTAFISGFLIEDEDSVYNAYVKEKKAAKKEYAEAVKNGRTAAHVSLRARNSNLFAVSVNVRALKKVAFNLTYEELLTRKLGVYKHVINLDPGQIVQDLSVQVNIQEFSRISYLEVPAFKTGSEVFEDPNQDVGPSPLARILRSQPYTAVVRWEPTPEQQEELALKGVRGQLVVKYDVDREQYPQQILVNDGYFVHFFAPPDLPPLQKHVIFVLDISGSMTGRKIRQLKEAMNKTLGDLRPTDYFSLVRFSGKARVTKAGKRFWKTQNTNAGSRQQQRNPEPMIIFLTDGEPTEGKTNPNKIVTGITARNKKVKASIFCLALGNGADFEFLKKLSLRNSGFARKIFEASDTAMQLNDFYREVASPLLANVTFKYLTEQIDPTSLTQKQFYFFYSGSELVVSGHLQPTTPADFLQYEVKALSPEGLAYFEPPSRPMVVQYEPLDGDKSPGLMERLWAYLIFVCHSFDFVGCGKTGWFKQPSRDG
ncbi:Inter-alpha-trypsin inhibitor heavy chain H4 [Blattella germanica]|nr:Inter-alpha-trypsin inhibitor heavy chain H4 [Blattella germanica]